MKMNDRYPTYCANIAELILNLEEARRSVQDWNAPKAGLERKILNNIGLPDGSPPEKGKEQARWRQEVKDRQRWLQGVTAAMDDARLTLVIPNKPVGILTRLLLQFKRARGDKDAASESQESWEEGRDRLAKELVASPRLLNRVLHVLDRGDETYFLYLTGKVIDINVWLSENKLSWSGHAGHSRILEAWPWQGTRKALEDKRLLARGEMKKPDPAVGEIKGEQARVLLQQDVDKYFDFNRKWEFQDKIKAWRNADNENNETDEAKTAPSGKQRQSLENLVYSIFAKGSGGTCNPASELASFLFDSPKEQSKLALLLGLPPSRWLIEEEQDSIAARRALKLGSDDAKTSAVPSGMSTPAPVEQESSTPSGQLATSAAGAVKSADAPVDVPLSAPDSVGMQKIGQQVIPESEVAVENDVVSDEAVKDDPIKESISECPRPAAEHQGADGLSDSEQPSSAAQLDVSDKIGLCFSGGGIRSATFNLGVLQALAELDLLTWVDYLSTVSGGGYIHQWVAAWWRRATASADPTDAFRTVNKALVAQPDSVLPGIEPTQISFLRRFSNYLTPEKGALSADSWTLVAIWARNTFLNQLVLLTFFLTLFGLLRMLLIGLEKAVGTLSNSAPVLEGVLILLAVAFFLGFGVYVLRRVRIFSKNLDSDTAPTSSNKGDGLIAAAVLLLLLAALLFTVICSGSIINGMFPIPAPKDTLGAWLTRAVWWPSLKAVLFLLCVASPVWLVMVARTGFANLVADRATETKWGWLSRGLYLLGAIGVGWLVLWVVRPIARYLPPIGVILPSASEALVFVLALVLMVWPLLIAFAGLTPKLFELAFPNKSRLPKWLVFSAILAGGIVMAALALTFWTLDQELPGIWLNLCFSENPFVQALVDFSQNHPNIWMDSLFLAAPPVLVAALFLASVLHVGLNKHMFRDESLEWAARLRAWGFLLSFGWAGFLGCLILSAPLLSAGLSMGYQGWTSAAAALWAAISGAGVLAGKSKSTSGDPKWQTLFRQALMQIAPYVFIAGCFVIVSWLVSVLTNESQHRLIILLSISLVLFVAYGFGVDINEFSMHSFYRNRLARCYQGASVVDRRPDAFTGFSRDDRAIRLGELRIRTGDLDDRSKYPGPFPIFCCTANFTVGEDLAWQERKGASFAYTPLYSGYDVPWTGLDDESVDKKLSYNGYRDTFDLGHPNGPGLADVSAISGAAVSPTWGYHTSPAIAFLLTCFNVRLGVWTRNTRRAMREERERKKGAPSRDFQSPRFAPLHLLMELFGQANAKREFLYLSDGGHFDNMGLYELVRRECRYIVICDAEEDGNITFEGMAMALRKCRSDFGVEIDLDLRAMRKAPDTGQSGVHCVVGTILYPNEDPETPGRDRGKIVYMKSTLTGSEPADLLSYKLEHSSFPHDSTGDQWFSESQFESYRVLGRSIAMTALKPACTQQDRTSPREERTRGFFNRLYDIWYPVTPAIERHLSNHGTQFDFLLRELRSKDAIAANAKELFRTGAVDLRPNATTEEMEYFDAFALSLFDFMWRVFNDLDLQIESNREHPQGKIWISTFKKWAEMNFVREAWPIYGDRYPASFHFFLVEHLNFKDTDE
jgi:hypothetical protein